MGRDYDVEPTIVGILAEACKVGTREIRSRVSFIYICIVYAIISVLGVFLERFELDTEGLPEFGLLLGGDTTVNRGYAIFHRLPRF